MSETPRQPKVGDWFILKASYCGGRNPGCTDDQPCAKCLKYCNRFVIGGEHQLTKGKIFFFAPTLCDRNDDGYMESTHCSVLTDDEKTLKEHGLYAHRLSEILLIDNPDLSLVTRQRDELREKLGIIARNVKAGAVSVYWCGEFAEQALASVQEKTGDEKP